MWKRRGKESRMVCGRLHTEATKRESGLDACLNFEFFPDKKARSRRTRCGGEEGDQRMRSTHHADNYLYIQVGRAMRNGNLLGNTPPLYVSLSILAW